MSSRTLHLVPTESHADHALARGRTALPFRAFLDDLTRGMPIRAATPEVTRLATWVALDEAEDDLGWQASHALAFSLDDAIGFLRAAGATPRLLRGLVAPRAGHFARVLERADEMLASRGLFDDRAVGWLAAEAIDRLAPEELPAAVSIDGIFRYDPSQFAWIEALARRVPVTVRVPRAHDQLLTILEGRWMALERAPDLEPVELALPEHASVVRARTEAAEARAIAGTVQRALREGTPAEGIAILVPDLEEAFLEPLRAALEEAHVAYREPRGRPPIAAPAVRAALWWLELATAALDRDVLIDLLRTGAVDPRSFVEGRSAGARRHRARALASRLARLPVRTDRDGTLIGDLLCAEVGDEAAWMVEAFERIADALADLGKEATRGAITDKLTATWLGMGLGEPSFEALRAFVLGDAASRETSLLAAQLRDQSAGFGALLDAALRVRDAGRTLGLEETVISPARFRAELERALSGVAASGTRRPGAVRIVRVTEVVRLPSDLLIVVRANEHTLERPSGSVFVDEQLAADLPSFARPPMARDVIAAQRIALLAAIDGAERLVLTRSETDDEGRPTAPAALFRTVAEKADVRVEPASRLGALASTLSLRGTELRALALGAEPEDAELRHRVNVERERLAFFLDPRRAARAWSGAIDVESEAVREHLRWAFGGTSARPMSVTAVERAAQCRFSAFASIVLGASTAETMGEGLEPWQRGSLIHRALFVALEVLRKQPSDLPREERATAANAAARKALIRDAAAPLYRAEVDRALRDVRAVIDWSIDDASTFRFAYAERAFGSERAPTARGESPWPALAIGSGDARIFVKGRIDRVDLSPSGREARVIDYKSSAPPAWKDVGTQIFQPPLYASVVLEQLGRLSAPEVRSTYLETSKRPPRLTPNEKSQVLSIEAIENAEAAAARVVLDLWGGRVAPRPADASVCTRCEVRDVCRRPAAMPIEELEAEGDGPVS